jgi:hypothetical protein
VLERDGGAGILIERQFDPDLAALDQSIADFESRSRGEDAMVGGRARNLCRKTRDEPKRRYSARERG